jgi:acyl-CoA thioester hydrolase
VTRIALQEQPEYEFHYEIQIQIGHLYYSGRAGHDALMRIAHEARVQLFHLLGVNENDFGDNRTGIIIGDVVVSGIGNLFLFDYVQVDSHVGNMGRSGFRLFHRFKKGDHLIALLETGLMTFDYRVRSVVPVPATFRNALRQYVDQRVRRRTTESIVAT